MKEDKKKIPLKNYLILASVSIITVVLTLYINAWIKTYKVGKNDTNSLSGVVQEITINEINVTLAETNQVILYVGVNGSNDFDENILKRIKNDELNDYFYYLNVTGMDSGEVIKKLKKSFSNIDTEINSIPMFIFIKNGKAQKVIDSSNRDININDLDVLIENYMDI